MYITRIRYLRRKEAARNFSVYCEILLAFHVFVRFLCLNCGWSLVVAVRNAPVSRSSDDDRGSQCPRY